uniref:Acetylornithine aminotransferase n=1 Tax=uncultured nuHF1 cluster bacterium HF0770_35I22 TaxID=723586 RepID=E7C7M8_9BACT|nr:ornithine/acetylornithine aminotransferase [uncultured nuHF1 cluster bacterium HF0770_35I22]
MTSSVMPTYGRYNFALVKGEGAYVYDAKGHRYLDFGSGIAVNSVGHCHPHLVKTLQRQAETFWHCSNLYYIPNQDKLADRLIENSFPGAVFFNNSGAEATELSVKVARRFQSSLGFTKRFRTITIEGAFHGRSLAMLAAGKQEKHLKGFGPIVEGFDQVKFGNLTSVERAITDETAAVIVEPIQGEGGVRSMDSSFLKGLRQLCDKTGILLIVDEVQSGVGRTGKLFAYQHAGITPDIMALAKGLGGGFPIGACIARSDIALSMGAGSHGSTFGGNPLATAVADAVLDVILAPGFLENVKRVSSLLFKKLEVLISQNNEVFSEVRGVGLMIGLKCQENVENGVVVNSLMENGLLTVPAGDNVVRLIPPLIIDDEQVSEAINILHETSSSFK